MTEQQWLSLRDALLPGTQVTVRVHRVRQLGMHRWPVQLSIVYPDIQSQLIDPDTWYCPVDLGWAFEQAEGQDFNTALALLDRPYTTTTYYPDRDASDMSDNLQYMYGQDESDIHAQPSDWISVQRTGRYHSEIADAVSAVAAASSQ
jgi:hypothetical protein